MGYNDCMTTEPKERLAKNTPLKTVEYIIAITTVLGGLFLLTPWIAIPIAGPADSEIVKGILSRPGLLGLAIFAIGAGSAHGYGLWKHKFTLRSVGLFFNILIRVYAILANWLIEGAMPLPVSAEFVLLYIVIVLWLTLRLEKWDLKIEANRRSRDEEVQKNASD